MWSHIFYASSELIASTAETERVKLKPHPVLTSRKTIHQFLIYDQ